MAVAEESGDRAAGSPEPGRFDDPIEFFHAEHDRQLILLAAVERLADDPGAPGAAESAAYVLAYLETELPRHVDDEERDLFPLLARRAAPEDGFADILAALRQEHEADAAYCRMVIRDLRALARGRAPADRALFGHRAHAFAGFQQRHLAWENSVLLPLARRRLEAGDLDRLRRALAARRGVRRPE